MLCLASASPRRRVLLQQLGVEHTMRAVNIDERPRPGESPPEYVSRLALAKARAARRLCPEWAVLGADTVVVCDGTIYGKPADAGEAGAMLRHLSGRGHQVMTSVALVHESETRTLSVSTVYFKSLREEEIQSYLATGEPFDKAGAYAIQGYAGAFIVRLEGSYSGVMGLPLYETAQLLNGANIPLMNNLNQSEE